MFVCVADVESRDSFPRTVTIVKRAQPPSAATFNHRGMLTLTHGTLQTHAISSPHISQRLFQLVRMILTQYPSSWAPRP
ncbi:hypothetical protein PROFUN_09877 [Planoprotostelium fungivorum]|uniref:Uncharacterized protein n=1 Tax=Planoprotostelium fungivorum TaxID=1890364 RepID=A0A2P6NGG6_9EUKA|nr:hypothetical protein PROFUN_09877 [Planoprotostelium fungivorum]